MSNVDSLVVQIEELSNKIESKLKSKNEEACPALLNSRQGLLEKLANTIDSSDTEELAKYQRFLFSLQSRDNIARANVIEQQKLLLSQSNQQAKTKKAIKAYNKFGD